MENLSDAQRQVTVLLLSVSPRHGTRSVGRTLAGLLREEPHALKVIEIDLHEELTGQSVLHTLASLTGMRVDAAALAARGWPIVEERLAGARPQAVVCLDPMVAAAVDSWRRAGRIRVPLVGVTLGMRLDPAWGRVSVDRLMVADEQMGEGALQLGIPPECIVPCGIPVCGGFSSVSEDRALLRRRFGIPDSRPVVLVVTDGLEHELTGLLFQLGLVAERATVMFDVARDDDAADLLRRRAEVYGVEARMFGKTEQAGELWASADLVLSRPHLYVEQRAIALRLPFVHLFPDGEVEEETARVYAEREIGRVVHHVSTLAAELELQLAPEALDSAQRRIASISRRVAAGDMARLVAQVSASAEQVLGEQRSAPEPAPPAHPAPDRGPLETIGALDPSQDPVAQAADLEAAEAEANRQVSEHQREVELWNRRAALAADKGASDLEGEARRLAEQHLAAMHRALAELGRVAQRKGLAPARGKVERDFRRLEVEDALAVLKRKMDRGER